MLQQMCLFSVRDRELELAPPPTIMSHTKNYLKAKFSFTGDWNSVSKTVVFLDWGNKAYNVVLDETNVCTVPWEVIKAPAFRVVVYGGDFAITNTVEVPVKRSDYKVGSIPAEPTPDIYNQLLTQVQSERQLAQTSAQEASQNASITQADKQIILTHADQIAQTATTTLNARSEAIQAANNASTSAAMAANSLLNGVGTHNQSSSAHSDIREAIQQVESIARGRATGYVFDTFADMSVWLENPVNIDHLVLGDNLYIRDIGVKDYWWDGTQPSLLESECPDLTKYYTKEQVATLLPILISRQEYEALVLSGNVEAGRRYDIIEEDESV